MMTLYAADTANGQKAAIVLEALGFDYALKLIDLYKGEHRQADFLRIHPAGRIPLITDGGRTVYGSLAIALYLADKMGDRADDEGTHYLGATAEQRAQVYEWLGIVATDLAPAFAGHFVFTTLAPEQYDYVINHYEKTCHRLLALMQQRLAVHPWLAGEQLTLADLLAYPHIATSAQRLPPAGADDCKDDYLSDYQHIHHWKARLEAMPAVVRGMRACRP